MNHPMVVMLRDTPAGPSKLHAHDRARQQPDCAGCDVWSNKRLLWDASEPFIGLETTINTENSPATNQAVQTAMATAQTSETSFQIEGNPDPVVNMGYLETTTSSLQSETTSIQPPTGNRPTGLQVVPVFTPPAWSSVSSLTTTTSLATQPETTSTTAPTTTQSALGAANNRGGDSISTKTTIAIVVPVSVVGLALFAGLLFFFLKRRRRERQLASASNPSLVYAIPKREPSWGDFGSTPRERTSFGTMAQRPIPHSHTLTPDTQSLNRELRPPPSADSRSGVRGRFTEQVHSIYAPDGSPMALTAENMSHHEHHTPRSPAWPLSPFGDSTNNNNHNNDDAASVVSGLSDRPGPTQNRDLDDVSSISSIDDNERRRNTRP
ncbi:hypothetical protein BDV37DRAFT_167107 [Aspergillus pseudonomiae]|uniref:Mid2 domain-containing protein n=1 Tax=Aspergillus pseudonomiae TaxID=1506151 RepID=A0A5N7D6J3_9EURO|nr:uncharacterized protein BDV37DRAFT_167107 [Aspergillus pseudonomiae]KAE8402025.1 hypothetical protein BDV37DRAFT_167107 [Aspergillus pseudonomiae]